jgi:hypothetical protein
LYYLSLIYRFIILISPYTILYQNYIRLQPQWSRRLPEMCFNSCSGGGSDRGGDQTTDDGDDGGNGDSSQGRKTLEDYCVELLGRSEEDCGRMADGNDIKVPGLVYLLCQAIRLGGITSTGGLSALLNC